jgi:hypothetical protein
LRGTDEDQAWQLTWDVDPAQVVQIRPMWLHQPRRLAGLTMIAVLTVALLEAQVRRWIAKSGRPLKALRPEKRGDAYPTATALLEVFAMYAVFVIQGRRGREELHLPTLSPLQQTIWDILKPPTLHNLRRWLLHIGFIGAGHVVQHCAHAHEGSFRI